MPSEEDSSMDQDYGGFNNWPSIERDIEQLSKLRNQKKYYPPSRDTFDDFAEAYDSRETYEAFGSLNVVQITQIPAFLKRKPDVKLESNDQMQMPSNQMQMQSNQMLPPDAKTPLTFSIEHDPRNDLGFKDYESFAQLPQMMVDMQRSMLAKFKNLMAVEINDAGPDYYALKIFKPAYEPSVNIP